MVKSEEVFDDTVFGFNLGKPNRLAHFAGLKEAKVEIDGKEHVFALARPNFWTTCPELRDTDTTGMPVRDFLSKHNSLTSIKSHPNHFNLEVLGNGQFRILTQS
jgi:hypothetical protein